MKDQTDSLASFVAKWHKREPEMQLAEVFCPTRDKQRFRAWGALLHELRETLFELSDARITAVKASWWAEELMGLPQARHRHPLTEALAGIDAPWVSLSQALLQQSSHYDRHASDTAEAVSLLLPLAKAVIAVEAVLFKTSAQDSAGQALAIHWLWQRLPQGIAMEDQARIPMHLFARHGLSAAQLAAGSGEVLLRDWAQELVAALPAGMTGNALIRRVRAGFDQAQLERLVAGKGFTEPAALVSFWRAWRVARRP